jgi:hypothetical protein
MKYIKLLLVSFIAISFINSCTEEDPLYQFADISAPSELNAVFNMATDDSGEVTVTPTATGASSFKIYFGDAENESPTEAAPGETVLHRYINEGEYNIKVVAVGLTGLTSELVRVITISFAPPKDLSIDVVISTSNAFEVTVTPTAENATMFDVFFGDVAEEVATTILAGESAMHIYAEEGTFTIKVVAKSVSATTIEITEDVIIAAVISPLELPITFDDAAVSYDFGTFNGATYEVVDNPDLSGVNTVASKVGAITNSGVNWEGGAFNLGTPVDFSGTNKTIAVKVWSNTSAPVLLKFEGGVNNERQNEVTANHGGTGWELLSFDFAANATKSYIDGTQGVGEPFVPTGQYSTIVLFIDGPGTSAGTFYIDDVEQVGAAAANLELPINFDNSAVAYDFGTFNGASYEVVTNPELSGTNTAASNVGAVTNSGANWEGGAFNLDTPVDFSGTNKTITLKLYSTAVVPILLKFEGGVNAERQNEVVVNHGGTGWEDLSFDFGTNATKSYIDGSQGVGEPFVPTGQYATIVIFIDGPGTTAGTFYIDDIAQTAGSTATEPTVGPEAPTAAASEVFSIFSDAYTDPAAVNYRPDWGQTTAYEQIDLGGDAVIKYSNLNYEGIDFGETVDASAYETLHIDVWSADYTELPFFMISAGSGENSVTLNLVANQWNSIDIPLTDFTSQGLTVNDLIQFKIDVQPNTGGTVYLDNLYFQAASTGGTTIPPSFPIDFETDASGALAPFTVFENVDNPALEIMANPDVSGVNTSATVAKFTARAGGQPHAGTVTPIATKFTLDATNSTVKIMVWKSVISNVGIKFEANAASTGEILIPNTLVNQWEEISFDFSGKIGEPSSIDIDGIVVFPDFDNRTQENIVYFDNISMSAQTAGSTAPTMAAPNPSQASANVISMFSNAYTNVTVDTWRTDWSNATLEDILVAGDDVKKYSALSFVGIETVSSMIDATTMTHFRTDIWTADATEFKIKLVDFGADATFGGGDDTEHEITIASPAQETWVSLDIPLSDFTGLTSRANISQLIYVGAPDAANTVFIDNVYFYSDATAPTAPTVAAPTPSEVAANVISMFSNAYTNVTVDTWRTDWSNATLEDILVAGDDVKKYSALSFVGIETVSSMIDATSMTHFRTDIWTADATEFKIKLVDFGADAAFGGGDDTEHEITIASPAQGSWVSLDIPLSDFTGLTSRANISQLIYVGAPDAANTVFIDNVYFHN